MLKRLGLMVGLVVTATLARAEDKAPAAPAIRIEVDGVTTIVSLLTEAKARTTMTGESSRFDMRNNRFTFKGRARLNMSRSEQEIEMTADSMEGSFQKPGIKLDNLTLSGHATIVVRRGGTAILELKVERAVVSLNAPQ